MTFWAGATAYLGRYKLDGDVSDGEDTNIWGGGPTVGLDFAFGESIMSMELGLRVLDVDYDTDYDDIDDFDDFEETIDADLDDLTFRFNWYF